MVMGIEWIERGSQRASGRYWDEDGIGDHLASLLDKAWKSHNQTLKSSPSSLSAFMRLLSALVSNNNRIALQLRDEIVGGAPTKLRPEG
jgi:hypothetical protein